MKEYYQMTKRSGVILLSILVAALFFFYEWIGPPPPNDIVRVVTPPSIIASLPVWIADAEQMFARRNLEIQFVDVTDSHLMVEAMLAGNADVLPAVSIVDLATTGGPGNLALMHVMIYSHSRMKKALRSKLFWYLRRLQFPR